MKGRTRGRWNRSGVVWKTFDSSYLIARGAFCCGGFPWHACSSIFGIRWELQVFPFGILFPFPKERCHFVNTIDVSWGSHCWSSLFLYLSSSLCPFANSTRDVTFTSLRYARVHAYTIISAGWSILDKLFRANTAKSSERRSTSCVSSIDKCLERLNYYFSIKGFPLKEDKRFCRRRKIAKSFCNYYL